MNDYYDEDFDEPTYSRASKKSELLRRIADLEESNERLRSETREGVGEISRVKREADSAIAKARAAQGASEMALRSVRAAVQTLLNLANDQPISGQFHVDPANGQVTRVPAG